MIYVIYFCILKDFLKKLCLKSFTWQFTLKHKVLPLLYCREVSKQEMSSRTEEYKKYPQFSHQGMFFYWILFNS